MGKVFYFTIHTHWRRGASADFYRSARLLVANNCGLSPITHYYALFGLTQQGLADLTDIHIQQIKRYEAGTSEPSAEALRKIATSLHVTTDSLLFEDGVRGPDDELRLQFEAVSAMPAEEKHLAKSMLAAIILQNQVAGAVRQLPNTPAAKEKKPASAKRQPAAAHR